MIWAKLTSWAAGLLTRFFVPVISFMAGRRDERNRKVKEELKDAEADKKIANEPPKSPGAVLQWLRDISERK